MQLDDPAPYLLWGGVSFALVLLTWRGWRKGVARQAAEIMAVCCAWVAGYFAGPLLVPILGVLEFPPPVLRLLGGAVVGLLVYLLITITASALFKKTEQQGFPPLRLMFGLGGAAGGLLLGLVVVFGSLIGLRLYGTLLEPRLALPGWSAQAPPWMTRLVKVKQALEGGLVGSAFQTVDPVPDRVYSTTEKMGEVLADPRAMDRLLAFPGVRTLATHPKMVALREDPELIKAAQSFDYVGLLRNPRLLEVYHDPAVAALLQRVDFERALDYALAQPGAPR